MKLTGKLSTLTAMGLLLCMASAVPAADPVFRGPPISKVWRRSAPNERFLSPPALLRPAPANSGLPTPFSNKIDLNRASLQQLQDLPGVGPAMGAHLMAGRPYRSIGDLARDGIPLNTIEQIAPLIELGP